MIEVNGRRVEIAPSVLSADFTRLGEHVAEAEAAGADIIHVDIMDGHFVPNITVGPLVVRALRRATPLPLHVHLMIEKPERYIPEFAAAGADVLFVHVETCPHLHRTLEQIRQAGARPAVTLNPATPLVMLEEALDQVDLVLIMSVNPGFGGQEFIRSSLRRVRRLRETIASRGLDCRIEIDGGINVETIGEVVAAGAEILVIGSAVFAAPEGVAAAMDALRGALISANGCGEQEKDQPCKGAAVGVVGLTR